MIEKKFLRDNKDTILNKWAQLSREYCPAAETKSIHAIRNHLPQLLDAFYEALEAKGRPPSAELSKTHGRQRFSFVDYTLSQVLTEYSLLKQVLFNELNSASELNFDEFFFIDRFFDSAANTAATEFARLREDQLRRHAAELEATNNDLERFAAIAAHDLRSPAATIISYSEILCEQNLDPDSHKSAQSIHRTATRIIALVDQLLSYAKLGKSQYSAKIVSLKQATDGALENLTKLISSTNVEVNVDDLPTVHGDLLLLIQLFQNLIANAVKFRSPDRVAKIEIRFRETPLYYVIDIQDNGIGFDPTITEEIFEPFKRGSNASKIAGSGLGLATCKRIVEIHGGTIMAQGNPGQGAIFSIQLPKPII